MGILCSHGVAQWKWLLAEEISIYPSIATDFVFVITRPPYNHIPLLFLARYLHSTPHRSLQFLSLKHIITPFSSHERQDCVADTLHRPKARNVRSTPPFIYPSTQTDGWVALVYGKRLSFSSSLTIVNLSSLASFSPSPKVSQGAFWSLEATVDTGTRRSFN